MKLLPSLTLLAGLAISTGPVLAQGADNGAGGSVPGLGPGGSGSTGTGQGATSSKAPGAADGTGGQANGTQDQVLKSQGVPAGNQPAE